MNQYVKDLLKSAHTDKRINELETKISTGKTICESLRKSNVEYDERMFITNTLKELEKSYTIELYKLRRSI